MKIIRYDDDPLVKALADPEVYAVELAGPENGQPVRITKDVHTPGFRVTGGHSNTGCTVVNQPTDALRVARGQYHGATE